MATTSLRYIYHQYIDNTPESYHCTEEEYKEVCYLFNKKVSDRMIDEGWKFKMPGRLGTLSVAKNKMKFEKLHFDYQHWKTTGEKAFHLNEHSDNYYAFARWNKTKALFKNRGFYGFKFTRCNNRRVAQVMKTPNGHQHYEIATRKDAI